MSPAAISNSFSYIINMKMPIMPTCQLRKFRKTSIETCRCSVWCWLRWETCARWVLHTLWGRVLLTRQPSRMYSLRTEHEHRREHGVKDAKKLQWVKDFLKKIRRGHWYPCFWTSGDASSEFQSQIGQLYLHLPEACVTCSLRFASGLTPADLLTATVWNQADALPTELSRIVMSNKLSYGWHDEMRKVFPIRKKSGIFTKIIK